MWLRKIITSENNLSIRSMAPSVVENSGLLRVRYPVQDIYPSRTISGLPSWRSQLPGGLGSSGPACQTVSGSPGLCSPGDAAQKLPNPVHFSLPARSYSPHLESRQTKAAHDKHTQLWNIKRNTTMEPWRWEKWSTLLSHSC